MHIAKQKCQKLKMGGVKWSPALQKTRNTILVWTLVQQKLKGRKVGSRQIISLWKKLKISNTNVDLATVKVKLD